MKRISIFGLAALMTLGLASCGNSQSQKAAEASSLGAPEASATIAKNVSPDQFQQLIKAKSNGIILDVRTPQEVAQGAISGHIAMNFYDPNFREQLKTLDKNKPVMVYCKVGGRSGNTMQLLKGMGFKEVYNLSGGIMAWQRQGLPIK